MGQGAPGIHPIVSSAGPEMYELSGKAKDAASAMIMSLILLAGFIWLLVILGRLI
ncbi:MAG: diacylglycerol kinase [Pseudomonadota bacterium]